jgi:hypothetical protein
VRSNVARPLSGRYASTTAIATVDTGTTSHVAEADITLSPTWRRANAALTVAAVSYSTNFFCKVEVTAGNPNGLMSIGRRINGTITSLLASVKNAGFSNGSTYHVVCGRQGNVITMQVGSRSLTYRLTSSDLRAVGSATRAGLRTHLASDEDDGRSTYDDFVVGTAS